MTFGSAANAAVVISQVYGGGGNTGATIKNDFIELFNNGSTTQTIGGWSVQYAAATGTAWASTSIPAGTTLPPGRYFLIRQAMGTAAGTSDIAFDLSGTIAMSGTNGKVTLVDSSTLLAGTAPAGANILDIVSYGGTATPTEGTPTASLTNTTAASRNAAGCTDTGNNSADFTLAAPAPRSLATTPIICGPGGPGGGPSPLAAAIYTIQGSGPVSPLVGQRVATSGVVTKILNNGFFIQDLVGDGNPATSDGILVFTGADVLMGGLGNNVFVYQSMRGADDGIADFVPGKDRIDLSALLASIGYTNANAYSLGVDELVASGTNTLLQIDTDAATGPGIARTLATLINVLPGQIVPLRDFGIQ